MPPNLRTISEMSRLLRQNDRPLKFNNGRFSERLVTDSDGKNHLILFDGELMKKVPHISTLLIDTTFDPTPNLTDATQLFVVASDGSFKDSCDLLFEKSENNFFSLKILLNN